MIFTITFRVCKSIYDLISITLYCFCPAGADKMRNTRHLKDCDLVKY